MYYHVYTQGRRKRRGKKGKFMKVRGQRGCATQEYACPTPVKMKQIRNVGDKRFGIKAYLPEIPSSVKCSVVKRKSFIKFDDLPDVRA